MVQRIQRARREGVAVDLVQVLVRDVVEVLATRKQEGRHVVLRAQTAAGNHDSVNRILGRCLARRQISQIAVVHMVQLVGRVRDLLRIIRNNQTHVDHLTNAAVSIDHQTVGVGTDLMSVHTVLQRGIATSHVNRQIVAILVSFFRLHVDHWELQVRLQTQKNSERLQRERHGRVVRHTPHMDTGTRRGSKLSVLHVQVFLRTKEGVHLH